MGTELAPHREWSHERSLDWDLAEQPERRGLLQGFMEALGTSCTRTHRVSGAAIPTRRASPGSTVPIVRTPSSHTSAGTVEDHVVVVLNCTPVPRERYRIGATRPGPYVERFNSDDASYGGSQFTTEPRILTDSVACHGRSQSLHLRLPPLAAIVLAPES